MYNSIFNSYELIYNKNLYNPSNPTSNYNITFVNKLKKRLYAYNNLDKSEIKYFTK